MKKCMKCGKNYDGYDGDMIDCPHCGEYGGNSMVYEGNGHTHPFRYGSDPASCGDSSLGSDASGFGCIAVLVVGGMILSSVSAAEYVFAPLWGLLKFAGIILAGTVFFLLLYGLKKRKKTASTKTNSGNSVSFIACTDSNPKPSFSDASSEGTASKTERTAHPYAFPLAITVTDNKYYKSRPFDETAKKTRSAKP